MNKMREYERGREDGLTLALWIARQGGLKRCQRYMDKVAEGADLLMDDLATWPDYINSIKEDLGMELEIRWND